MRSHGPTAEADSLCALFQATAHQHRDAVALRSSDGLVSLTWGEYAARVRSIAAGLAGLGVRAGDTVGLALSNRPEFHLVDMAVLHLGATPFSVYNTSPPEQVRHLFENAGNAVVVTETDRLDVVRQVAGDRSVVCVDGSPGAIALAEIETAPADGFDVDAAWRQVTGDTVATIIYTSGTTGLPKGVEIEHRAVLASLRSGLALGYVAAGADRGRLLSYLPDAHVANRYFAHYLALTGGSSITTVRDLKTVADALPQVRPTVFLGVPALWYRVSAAIERQLGTATGPKGALARWALATGRATDRDATPTLRQRVADRLVLRRVRQGLGLDDAHAVITGSAPIAPATVDFFRALGIPLCEGWAMSETAASGAINEPGSIRPGTVGRPMEGVELRLAEDGELLVRTPSLMRGYRDSPEQTRAAFTGDGWFRTGDIAEIDADGYVAIVDRKKDLIINSSGKNMAPAAIEGAVLAAVPLVASVIAIGDRRPYVTALLTLDPVALATFAEEQGLEGDPADLAAHPATLRAVQEGIDRANTTLSRVEQVKYFHVLDEAWVPGGDELTPTNKLRRRAIGDKYADQIERLYDVPVSRASGR